MQQVSEIISGQCNPGFLTQAGVLWVIQNQFSPFLHLLFLSNFLDNDMDESTLLETCEPLLLTCPVSDAKRLMMVPADVRWKSAMGARSTARSIAECNSRAAK